MEFRILGPLEVLEHGVALTLRGGKQRALLAALLLEANRVVASSRLIDALWEDDPPESAAKALQVYMSQLRKLLGRETVLTRPPGYVLLAPLEQIDASRFRKLAEAGRFAEALALWRGPALGDLADLSFARAASERLEEERLLCIEELLDRRLADGEGAQLVGELEALVRAHRLRERLRGQLMVALYRSGRQADALASYQDARGVFVEELGLEPGRELRALQQRILRQDVALAPIEAPVTPAESTRSAFVGRESELPELVAAMEQAFAGHGRLVLLVGEPGIGKSRLAEEAMRRCRERGAQVLVGRCWEAGGAPAYWPWVQSLRGYLQVTDSTALRTQLGAGAAELAQLLPELRELFVDLPDPVASESESARFRLFEAVAALLVRAAAERPLVLMLDDLHAADESSLLLLRFLARELGDSRILAIGAYRSVDPSPSQSLRATLADLIREPTTSTLTLGGLGEREVSSFIEASTGTTPHEGLVSALHIESEGNPLFVAEMVQLLKAEGGLDQAPPTRLSIPQSVRDVIARRLAHLSPHCNQVLLLASVLGREFRLDALARLHGGREDDVLDALDEAMTARVIADAPDSLGRLRFVHVLIRDTLYEGLTTPGRVRLHRLAVSALEALYGVEPGPYLAELAHHSVAGSDFEKGREYAERAGDRALASLAFEEAARLYETALEAAELAAPDDERGRCRLLLARGEAQARAGNTPEAKQSFLAAAAIARRAGFARELAQAAAGYGGRIVFVRAGSDQRLVPLLEEALAILDEDEPELRARLLARLAGALRDDLARDRRGRLSAEAVELARHAGNPAALAYALDGRTAAILAPDTLDECLNLATELQGLAEHIGDKEQVVHACVQQLIAHLQLGHIDQAERKLTVAGSTAEELAQPPQLWQVTGARAMIAIARGDLVDADRLVSQALLYGERSVASMAIPVYQLQRYTLADFHDRLHEYELVIPQLADEYPARPIFRAALAHLYTRLGSHDAAQATLDELARDRFSGVPFDMEWLFATSLLAETAASLNDLRNAETLYQLLEPWALLNVTDMAEGIRGSVERYLGLLASTLTRHTTAANHFERAIQRNAHMGFRPWVARTQSDYAKLLMRDGTRDTATAQQLLRQADATYHQLGIRPHAEERTHRSSAALEHAHE